MGGILQGQRCDKETYLLLAELRPPQLLNLEPVTVRVYAQHDEFNDCFDGPLEHPLNGKIVKNRPGEVMVIAGAKADQGDVAEQLWVVSGSVSKLDRCSRFFHELC